MIILQMFLVLFAIFMIYVVFLHRKRGTLDAFELGIWLALWAMFIFLVVFPDVLRGITQQLDFARPFDLLTLIAFMVLTIFVIDSRLTVLKLKKKIEDYVRKEAIEKTIKKTV